MERGNQRQVIRDPGFERALGALMRGDWLKAEAYIQAAEVVPGLDCEIGTSVSAGIWILPMAPVDDQEAWLHYTFFETVVILLDIEVW